MQRTLEFWLERLKKAQEKIYTLSVSLHYASNEYKYWKPYKLKKQYGHALNRDYTGYKIHKRRAKWIKRYLSNLTRAAKCRQEISRIRDKKISFYKAKIAAAGYILKESNYDD
jgi:hypothetical protein